MHKKVFKMITFFIVVCVSNSCQKLDNEVPPAVTPQVINIGVDYATINWNNAGKQYTYSIGLFRDSIVAVITGIPDTSFSKITDTTYTIKGLDSSTDYWIFVIVDHPTGDGPSSTSSLVAFTTK